MLINLTLRILPAALTCFGALLVIAGGISLVGSTETQATTVSITDLEEGDQPSAEWLRITDGVLFLPHSLMSFRMDSEGKERGTKGYWIPLVSHQTASEWTASLTSSAKPSFEKCRVIVFFWETELLRRFPVLSRGQSPEAALAFEADGTWKDGTSMQRIVRDKFSRQVANFEPARVAVLSQGERPLQKSESAAGLVMGLVFSAGGAFWWRKRRMKTQEPTGGLLAAATGGVQQGTDEAIRKTVASGVGSALQQFGSRDAEQTST